MNFYYSNYSFFCGDQRIKIISVHLRNFQITSTYWSITIFLVNVVELSSRAYLLQTNRADQQNIPNIHLSIRKINQSSPEISQKPILIYEELGNNTDSQNRREIREHVSLNDLLNGREHIHVVFNF